MRNIILKNERHNTFAAFLRSLKKGYSLNKEKARVEVHKKFFMGLN